MDKQSTYNEPNLTIHFMGKRFKILKKISTAIFVLLILTLLIYYLKTDTVNTTIAVVVAFAVALLINVNWEKK